MRKRRILTAIRKGTDGKRRGTGSKRGGIDKKRGDGCSSTL